MKHLFQTATVFIFPASSLRTELKQSTSIIINSDNVWRQVIYDQINDKVLQTIQAPVPYQIEIPKEHITGWINLHTLPNPK